jgi:hypothetical protein
MSEWPCSVTYDLCSSEGEGVTEVTRRVVRQRASAVAHCSILWKLIFFCHLCKNITFCTLVFLSIKLFCLYTMCRKNASTLHYQSVKVSLALED